MGFRFGFQLDQLGEAGGDDEVQQAITTDEGDQPQTRHPRRRPFSRHRLPSRSGKWAYGPAQSGLCRRHLNALSGVGQEYVRHVLERRGREGMEAFGHACGGGRSWHLERPGPATGAPSPQGG